jgi:hypothetical protein
MQLVAGPHRMRPTQFVESDAKDTVLEIIAYAKANRR